MNDARENKYSYVIQQNTGGGVFIAASILSHLHADPEHARQARLGQDRGRQHPQLLRLQVENVEAPLPEVLGGAVSGRQYLVCEGVMRVHLRPHVERLEVLVAGRPVHQSAGT